VDEAVPAFVSMTVESSSSSSSSSSS